MFWFWQRFNFAFLCLMVEFFGGYLQTKCTKSTIQCNHSLYRKRDLIHTLNSSTLLDGNLPIKGDVLTSNWRATILTSSSCHSSFYLNMKLLHSPINSLIMICFDISNFLLFIENLSTICLGFSVFSERNFWELRGSSCQHTVGIMVPLIPYQNNQ